MTLPLILLPTPSVSGALPFPPSVHASKSPALLHPRLHQSGCLEIIHRLQSHALARLRDPFKYMVPISICLSSSSSCAVSFLHQRFSTPHLKTPTFHHSAPTMSLSGAVTNTLTHSAVRHFSAQAPKPATRLQSTIAGVLITSAVVLPFVPPAIESKKERDLGHPNASKKHYGPLCCHA